MKLFKQLRSLTHQLSEYLKCGTRILSHECPELRSAYEECLGFLGRVCVGDINRLGRHSFDAEHLARCDDRRNEAPTGTDPVSQYHMSVEHE